MFFVLKNTYGMGPPRARERDVALLLHAGGRAGQLVEEQVGIAGAHLAGGHGGDTAERGVSALVEGG